MKTPRLHSVYVESDDLNEDENMTPATHKTRHNEQYGYIGLTPVSQQCTAHPTYAVPPTWAAAHAEGDPQMSREATEEPVWFHR